MPKFVLIVHISDFFEAVHVELSDKTAKVFMFELCRQYLVRQQFFVFNYEGIPFRCKFYRIAVIRSLINISFDLSQYYYRNKFSKIILELFESAKWCIQGISVVYETYRNHIVQLEQEAWYILQLGEASLADFLGASAGILGHCVFLLISYLKHN